MARPEIKDIKQWKSDTSKTLNETFQFLKARQDDIAAGNVNTEWWDKANADAQALSLKYKDDALFSDFVDDFINAYMCYMEYIVTGRKVSYGAVTLHPNIKTLEQAKALLDNPPAGEKTAIRYETADGKRYSAEIAPYIDT